MMKKSQMEILGLAIVVILILVATVFVVRFMIMKEPSNYRSNFLSAELASNTLNAFLKTTAPNCFQSDMTDLIEDCSLGYTIICNGEDSCAFVESTAAFIFSSTFDKWNIKYEFSIYSQQNPSIIKIGEKCSADKKSKLYLIPSTPTISAKLDICQ